MSSRLAWLNAIDAATLSTTGTVYSTLPVANLANPIPSKPFRTSASTSFTAVFASATDIDVLGLAGCTASKGDTIRHQLYNASNTLLHDSTVIDIDIAPGRGRHFYVPPATISAVKKWVCTIVATSLGSNPLDIGRAVAAPAWTPSIGFDVGLTRSYDNNFKGKRGRSGSYYPGDGNQWPVDSYKFSWLTEDERAEADDFLFACSPQKQLLFIPDVTGDMSRYGVIGRMNSAPQITQEVAVYPAAYTFTLNLAQDV